MDINLKLFRNFYGIIKLFQCFKSNGCLILFVASCFTGSVSRQKRYLTVQHTVCHFYSRILSSIYLFLRNFLFNFVALARRHTHTHTVNENERNEYMYLYIRICLDGGRSGNEIEKCIPAKRVDPATTINSMTTKSNALLGN